MFQLISLYSRPSNLLRWTMPRGMQAYSRLREFAEWVFFPFEGKKRTLLRTRSRDKYSVYEKKTGMVEISGQAINGRS